MTDNRPDTHAELPWDETNPEWWQSQVEDRLGFGDGSAWIWLVNEFAALTPPLPSHPSPGESAGFDRDVAVLAAAINDAQIAARELQLGHDLRPVAERVLAALIASGYRLTPPPASAVPMQPCCADTLGMPVPCQHPPLDAPPPPSEDLGLAVAARRLSAAGMHDAACPEPRRPCNCGIEAALARLEPSRVSDRSREHDLGPASEATKGGLAKTGLDEGRNLGEALDGLIFAQGGQVDGDLDVGAKAGEGLLGHADTIQHCARYVNAALDVERLATAVANVLPEPWGDRPYAERIGREYAALSPTPAPEASGLRKALERIVNEEWPEYEDHLVAGTTPPLVLDYILRDLRAALAEPGAATASVHEDWGHDD